MHELVSNYISKKEEEKRKKYDKEKREFLHSNGFYEVVYSDKDGYSRDYPYQEYDEKAKTIRWVQKNPIEVTDEEYETLKKYANDNQYTKNGIANALQIVAWIVFIGGFILGIICANVEVTKGVYYTYTDTEFSFAIAVIYWAISFISGIFLLGLAEIIELLNQINQKSNG